MSIFAVIANTLAVLAGYLIGAIPFGYLVARAFKGIDIRTAGSGNIGATNVGRVLGRGYGWAVLILDLLKGYLPVLLLPKLTAETSSEVSPDLAVLVGLAAIIGHTFPMYLKFRGGKGVATSLGVVLALDPISCALAVLVFVLVVLGTRYVSLGSLVGAAGFAVAHFVRTPNPIRREHIAMTLFTVAVAGLMVVRHRSNIARLRQGTENRVNFGRSKKANGDGPTPAGRPGRIGVIVVIGLTVLTLGMLGGTWLVHNASRTIEADAGPWSLRETDRLATGQQRVDRIAFAPDGDLLAGICPRYNRLLIYRLNAKNHLEPVGEAELEGRPVGVAVLGSRFVVLQRPPGDAKHLQPGWWEVFDREGHRVGSRQVTGFYPDDLAASTDGRRLFVLYSGRSEGDPAKPLGALEVLEVDAESAIGRTIGKVSFEANDDPERLTVSASSRYAAVFLAKSRRTVAVDVSDPTLPVVVGRTSPVTTGAPYVSSARDSDWIMMPAGSDGDTIAIEAPDTTPAETGHLPHPDYVVTSRASDSSLEILQTRPQHEVGRFPLLGPFNLGRTRPTGLAYSPTRHLIAVATRTGSIHVVELRTR